MKVVACTKALWLLKVTLIRVLVAFEHTLGSQDLGLPQSTSWAVTGVWLSSAAVFVESAGMYCLHVQLVVWLVQSMANDIAVLGQLHSLSHQTEPGSQRTHSKRCLGPG